MQSIFDCIHGAEDLGDFFEELSAEICEGDGSDTDGRSTEREIFHTKSILDEDAGVWPATLDAPIE